MRSSRFFAFSSLVAAFVAFFSQRGPFINVVEVGVGHFIELRFRLSELDLDLFQGLSQLDG